MDRGMVGIAVAVGKGRWGRYRKLLIDPYIVGVRHILLDTRPDNQAPEHGSPDTNDDFDSAVSADHNCRHT